MIHDFLSEQFCLDGMQENKSYRNQSIPCYLSMKNVLLQWPEYHLMPYMTDESHAYTEDYNVASQRVCEKLGMRREGLFLDFISFVNDSDGNPVYENTYQYAILKKEWLEGKR